MPTLKDLRCSIELSPTNLPLREFGTAYHDGFVQTFVVVPSKPTQFSIHLTSDGYIAPGMGMFVFIDSVYQCNRVRQGLKIPNGKRSAPETIVDIRVRQKEEKISKGTYIGRDWTFASLQKNVSAGPPISDKFTRNVGAIEVVILRCLPQEDAVPVNSTILSTKHKEVPVRASMEKPQVPSSKASNRTESASGGLMGLFDGANDAAGHAPSELVDVKRPHIKGYWAGWRKEAVTAGNEQAYVMPQEPLRSIPTAAAQDRSHQLQAGQGALYAHKSGSAKYMDTIEKPYAVFWFGYRSKEAIEKRLNIKIEGETVDVRQQMMHKTKEELVDELIKAQAAAQSPIAQEVKAKAADILEPGIQPHLDIDGKANAATSGGGWDQPGTNINQDRALDLPTADKKSTTSNKDKKSTSSNKDKKSTTSNKDKKSTTSNKDKRSTISNKDKNHNISSEDKKSITSNKEASQHPSVANANAEWGKTEQNAAEWISNQVYGQPENIWGSNKGSKKSGSKMGADFVKIGSTKGDLDWQQQTEGAKDGGWGESGPKPEAQGWS